VTALDDWIDKEARFAAGAVLRAVSATNLVKNRPGFGQRIVPRPGSVLASPVPAAYDPDPDYFFHWSRDSAIVIDALRVAETGLRPDRCRRLRDSQNSADRCAASTAGVSW
jgi:glucoamylase